MEGRTGAAFDVAYGGPVERGVLTSVNVARRDAPDGKDLAALVRDGQAEVEELKGGSLEFTGAAATTIDGEPARRYDFASGGARVRQVAALHDGGYYVVTLTAAEPAFARAVPRLDALLRSWRWD